MVLLQWLLVHIFLLTLWSLSYSAVHGVSSPPSLAKPDCQSHCGAIEIPYPFGVGQSCYHGSGFQILCNSSTNPPKPFLNLPYSRPEVLEISLAGTVKIKSPITFSPDCHNKQPNAQTPDLSNSGLSNSGQSGNVFSFSQKNLFTSVSCGRIATLMSSWDLSIWASCFSRCDNHSSVLVNKSCDGVNCCQTTLLRDQAQQFHSGFGPSILNTTGRESPCKYSFLVDPDWFRSNSTNTSAIPQMDDVPVLLEWVFYGIMDDSPEEYLNRICRSSSGPCSCSKGYQGNPYLLGGCQDINECDEEPNICGSGKLCSNYNGTYGCSIDPQSQIKGRRVLDAIIILSSVFGLLFVIIGGLLLRKAIKKRRNVKRKQRFFRLNGGLLLEQQLSSGEVNVEKIKLFSENELEKATDRFNVDRILGEGGQGTVYKGMLEDGRIVAVKKSKIIDGREVSQFINEIVILSQINHRNVVKLFGCCLESEVPLLVYEFLPNGTLSQYIHSRDEDFPLTWEVRLRVGMEVAGALSYLHSSASMPIYHRDIKSSNILLDEKYRAKIADFGTSRSGSIDKTHLTMTHVNGTFGYLDPEYFQSSQFTDKSDVYSFGVVLAELLTGQKPISVAKSQDGRQDGRSLATNFIVSMEESRLFDILDAEVIKGDKKEEIMAVANLAKRCLNMYGKYRPTMKEIAIQLEGILLSNKPSDVEQNIAEAEYVQMDLAEAWGISTSTWSHTDTSKSLNEQSTISFESH